MHNRLTLGTAQLGLEYGVSNTSGKPTRKKAFDILETAYRRGIRSFDTATAYGDAEHLLGEFLKSHGLGRGVMIYSKLDPEFSGNGGYDVLNELEKVLERLQVDCIEAFIFHKASDMDNDLLVSGMISAKKCGMIKKTGVSVYTPETSLKAVNRGVFDHIQLPFSLIDQRHCNCGFLFDAKKNGLSVHGRSAFLQGLLLMERGNIPKHLQKINPYLELLDKTISPYGFSRFAAAVLFSCYSPELDSVVFGVDSAGQLEQIADVVNQHEDFSECMEKLKGRFDDVPENLISPDRWESLK